MMEEVEDGRGGGGTANPVQPRSTATTPATATAAAAPTTTTTGSPSTEPPANLLSRLNDLLNEDYIYDIAYYGFWAGFWLFVPYVVLLALAGLAVYDAVTAKGYRTPRGPILVTGCDSGFGKALAAALAGKGWLVYAACLTDKGVAALTPVPNVTPLRMDVTRQEEVDAAVARIGAEHPEKGLYALVNNAGVDKYGTTDWCDLDHYRWHMEVNFFGHVRVTKACLPLLKKHARWAGGGAARIVNVTSFSGLLPGLPMKSAYGASKHAAESWSNSLRAELKHFGVEVCTVNPVWHRTEIAASQLPHLLALYEALPPAVQADYGRGYFEAVGEASFKGKQAHVWRAENVTKALVRAVTAEKHRPQHVVGMDGRFFMVPVMMLPRRLINAFYDGGTFGKTKPAGALEKGTKAH